MAAKKTKRKKRASSPRAVAKRNRVKHQKIMRHHARKYASAAKLFVRARTAELIHEGYEPAQAYAIANREAGTSRA